MHILNGYDLPLRTSIHLQYVVRGIKGVQGVSKRVQLPIRIHHLTMFDLLLPRSHSDNKMIWAAFTLAFFGFLRISEFTCNTKFKPKLHLTSSNIKFIPSPAFPQYMRVEIKGSKTDPFRKGLSLIIGQTLQTICLVCAMKEHLNILPQTWTGPLFTYSNGRRFTKQHLTSELRTLLGRLGLNSSHYAGHSFRDRSCNICSCVRPRLLVD